MVKDNKKINNWYGGFVNMGFVNVLHRLCSLLFERNLPSVIVASSGGRLAKTAFAQWSVGLENNTGDVIARQAEGLV